MENTAELCFVQIFYKNSTVFLTGITDLLSKLLLEKILRSLHVKKTYVLFEKCDKNEAEKQLKEICLSKAFEPLRRNDPNFEDRIKPLLGDCSKPDLGLSQDDKNLIINDVNIIFNTATTSALNENLQTDVFVNVRAPRDIINIAKQITTLKAFVHVSTAFSNCLAGKKMEINERIYKSETKPEALILLCESFGEKIIDNIKITILDDHPNTFLFTKQAAEVLVYNEARNMPACIVRPSIVTTANTEPLTGYVDETNPLVKSTAMQVIGAERILYRNPENIIDIVPIDFAVNHCISAGWCVGESYRKSKKRDVEIFNLISSQDNPIKVGEMQYMIKNETKETPTMKMFFYPIVFMTTCYYNFVLWDFLLHTVPAYVMDFILKFMGKQSHVVNCYKQYKTFVKSHEYLWMSEFYFSNDNTNKILKRMTFKDRELFNFDITTINWQMYFVQYIKGLRVYYLKDPLSTLTESRKRQKQLRRCYFFTVALLITTVYVFVKFMMFRIIPTILRV